MGRWMSPHKLNDVIEASLNQRFDHEKYGLKPKHRWGNLTVLIHCYRNYMNQYTWFRINYHENNCKCMEPSNLIDEFLPAQVQQHVSWEFLSFRRPPSNIHLSISRCKIDWGISILHIYKTSALPIGRPPWLSRIQSDYYPIVWLLACNPCRFRPFLVPLDLITAE